MLNRLQRSLFLAVCFALGIAPGVLVEGEPVTRVQPQQVIRDIPSINEVEQPLTTAEGLLVQQSAPTPAPAQVTGVQLQPTDKGLEVILETVAEFPEVLNSETENSLITDIPNAQLRLPKGGAFRQDNPTQDIAAVEVTNLDAKTIRVTVTGKTGVPIAEVSQSPQALILSVAAPPALAPSAPPATPAQPTPAPPPAQQKPEPQAEELLQFEVRAEEEAEGYNVPDATTATRTDTPLRDIPQSIQVVPQQVLEDQQAITLEDALRNVSGVTPSIVYYGSNTGFIIRGFETGEGNFLRDGLRDSLGGLQPENPSLERVEVLKGPASVLYGSGSPGGTINSVTKQPLQEPFYSAEATFGSYDFFRGAIDLSGPLNDSSTLLYRLNAAYRDSGSFVDFVDNDFLGIVPVLSFAIGESTRLTLEGEYIDKTDGYYPGVPVPVGVDLPRSRNLGQPSDNIEQTTGRIGYRLEHQLSNNWSLRNAFRAKIYHYEDHITFPDILRADNRTFDRRYRDYDTNGEEYALTTDLVGRFSTGSIEHQLLFGVDLNRFSDVVTVVSGTAAPIDIFDPEYDSSRGPLSPEYDSALTTNSLGIFAQDQVTLTENLKLLLGGRFDLYEERAQDFLTETDSSQSAEAFSPRLGIVYQPIPPISLYASYSRSFTPAIGRSFDGSLFEPERGTQYEIGVKTDLNDQLSGTLAFYDLTRTNVLTADPVNEGFSIQTGKQRSRGIELNVGGEILPGWNIIAGYAYTDAHITEDETYEPGNLLRNVPKNAFNLWSTYRIQAGELQGLGFGLGLFFVGEPQVDLDNSFELPSYLRTDAAIFYERDQFRAALNFRNLFDVKYFESPAYIGPSAFYGEPFTVQGTVSWQF